MNTTHPPRRFHLNVGVIAGNLWTAHDRGAAHKGVRAQVGAIEEAQQESLELREELLAREAQIEAARGVLSSDDGAAQAEAHRILTAPSSDALRADRARVWDEAMQAVRRLNILPAGAPANPYTVKKEQAE